MKKLITLLMLLCIGCMGAWAQATLKSSTDENSREHVFKMHPRNESGNYWLTSQLGSTQSVSGAGDFIFIPAEGENNYYIYSVTEQKWLTYNNAAIANGDNKVSLSNTKENYFKFEFGSATGSGADNSWGLKNGYLIKAINSSGTVTSQCLNWHGGPSNYNNNAKRIGFYSDGFGDAGCVWVLEENLVIGSDNSNFTEGWYQIQVSDGTYPAHEGYKGKFLKGEPNGSWGVTLTDNATDAKTYIYVTKSGDNFRFEFNKETADHYYAAQNSYKNVSTPGDLTFYVKEENANNYKWKIWGGSNKWCGWNINNIPSIGITSGNESQYQTCYYTFHKVNAPNTVSITYTYKIGEETVGTETFDVTIGAEFPNPSATYSTWYNYAKPENTVTETGSHDVQLTWNGPFEFTTIDGGNFAAETKWYYLKQGQNMTNYVYYANDGDKKNLFSTSKTIEDKYLWAFVRKANSPYFYMYNKAAGATVSLHEKENNSNASWPAVHNQGWCVFTTDGTNEMPLTLAANGSGYSIKVAELDNITAILGNHNSSRLSIWGRSGDQGVVDNGSRFKFVEFNFEDVVQELITEATAIVEGNNGTTIGKPAKAVVDALAAAVETASAANPKTEETYNTLQSAINTYLATTNIYLPTGYYYMKNLDGDRYVYNDYAHTGNDNHYTLVSNSKVTTNNGVWYVENNGDGSINIKNGEGQPMKGDDKFGANNTFTTLHFGVSQVDGGIYFTEGIHFAKGDYYKLSDGTYNITKWEHAESAGSNYTFEPVVVSDRCVFDVSVKGDEGEGYVTYNETDKAYNGGFIITPNTNDVTRDKFIAAELTGKAYEFTTFTKSVGNGSSIVLEYIVINDEAIAKLQESIDKIYGNITWDGTNIGYPNPRINAGVAGAYNEIFTYSTNATFGRQYITEEVFVTLWHNTNMILDCPDIVTPTPGAFYTFEDAEGNQETYYLTENNELLSYSNGQFAMPEYSEEKGKQIVDYAEIGTELGEGGTFAFMAARKNETGMPINFGKVCAMTDGAPLPSGDGNIYSGWTITKTEPSVNMNNINNVYYASMYMPTAVKLPVGVEAYEGKISNDGTSLKLTQIDLGGDRVLAANTPVVLISGSEISAADLTVSDAEGVRANENDFEGTAVTMPQDGTSTYYVLNTGSKGAGFYKYKAGKNVNGFKAYYRVPAASASAFSFVFDEGLTTGLENAVMEVVKSKAPIYNLQGTRVMNPVKGQIYIQNGKTIIY